MSLFELNRVMFGHRDWGPYLRSRTQLVLAIVADLQHISARFAQATDSITFLISLFP